MIIFIISEHRHEQKKRFVPSFAVLTQTGIKRIKNSFTKVSPVCQKSEGDNLNMSNNRPDSIKKSYLDLVHRMTPRSKFAQGIVRAFLVGGLICMVGQAAGDISHTFLHLNSSESSTFGSVFLIFLTALLTGIGVFDRIARYAGAGTVVPITGFANAMVSPAMEFRSEGWVLGTGAKLFTIAGPVLAYGISSSVIVGLLYYFIGW